MVPSSIEIEVEVVIEIDAAIVNVELMYRNVDGESE